MCATSNQPNPLPIHDANAELQRQSVHALHAITISAGMLLRGEQFMEYGVDATLEIVVGDRATNFLAQIQIKSTQCAELNQDGTVSKAIEVSNLNYLLNGTCPLYLFYSATHERFWYTWAFEELQRIESENPRWKEQKTVTIRFSRELTDASLKEIHSRIVSESTCRRDVVDALARYAMQEPVKFAIDRQALKAQDGEGAYHALIENGFTLISCGLWREVLGQVDLLASSRQQEPRIRLVVAYAYYTQGRYLAALANCGEARLRVSELSRADQEVLDMIRDACECQSGKITREEYTRRQARAAGAKGASLQCRIEAVRFQLLGERDESRRSELLRQMRALAAAVLGDADSGEAFKLQTRLHIAFAEGWENYLALSQSVGTLNIQFTMQQSWARPDPRPLAQSMSGFTQWEQRMQQLLRDTEASGIPWLHAEARRTALLVRSALIGFRRFQAQFLGMGERPARSEIEKLLTDAKDVADGFAAAGNIEGEMRAKIAAADLYEIVDDVAGAKAIAGEVRPIAEALGLAEVLRLAEQHLTGTTLLQTTESEMRKNRQEDRDLHWAAMSEADIDYYAERSLAASQLPADRLPMVRKDVEGMKLIANERLHWCRHIEQWQLLIHTWHPSTAYAAPTEWTGKCLKHGYESLQGSTDMQSVIARFKKSYCEGCPDRDPKIKS
jgi:hypothetical protein